MQLSYAFKDENLLKVALTHASVTGAPNNERLEFLGDAVLDLIVAEELYHDSDELPEGSMTQLKASVVSRKALAHAARRLQIGGEAQLGGGMRGRTLPTSVLANLYEAIVGALYLDGGYDAARAFVRDSLRESLEQVRQKREAPNPKQTLQQLCQARWGVLPFYRLLESRGQSHTRAFLVSAVIREEPYPSAWGRTRREAESWAAHEALLRLDDDYDLPPDSSLPRDGARDPQTNGSDA